MVPEGWRREQLGDLGALLRGRGGSKADEVPDGIPVIRYGELYTRHHEVIREVASYVPPERASQYTPLQVGDVLFASSGETLEEIGKSAVFLGPEPVHGSGDMTILRPGEGTDPLFLGYATNGPDAATQKARLGQGSSVMHLYTDGIAQIELLLPPLPEQKKIAAILSSVDDAIAATRKVIEQAEQVKKGLLQTLMTRGIGHTRFKKTEVGEIPEGWEVSNVGTEFKTQLGKMLSKAARSGPNQVPYLANAQVQWGRIVLVDLATMHFASAELAKFSLEPGDLLVCEGGEAGRTAIWEGADFTVSYQKAIHRLRSKGRILPRFLLRYMRLAHEDGRLTDYTSRTSIAHLTQEQLRRVRVPVPPIDEQYAITSQFEGVDAVLRRNATTLTHLQTLKRGLLQDLLTGRVRVTPD